MSVMTWTVVGLIAARLAKLFAPGLEPGGFIATMLVGVTGSCVGGGLGSAVVPAISSLFIVDLVMAAIGAAISLRIWHRLAGTRNI